MRASALNARASSLLQARRLVVLIVFLGIRTPFEPARYITSPLRFVSRFVASTPSLSHLSNVANPYVSLEMANFRHDSFAELIGQRDLSRLESIRRFDKGDYLGKL